MFIETDGKTIRALLACASRTPSRYASHGLYFHIPSRTIAATDGRILALLTPRENVHPLGQPSTRRIYTPASLADTGAFVQDTPAAHFIADPATFAAVKPAHTVRIYTVRIECITPPTRKSPGSTVISPMQTIDGTFPPFYDVIPHASDASAPLFSLNPRYADLASDFCATGTTKDAPGILIRPGFTYKTPTTFIGMNPATPLARIAIVAPVHLAPELRPNLSE